MLGGGDPHERSAARGETVNVVTVSAPTPPD
jgi:hypothetical protein